MAITRQKKEEILQELIDKFGKSKSIVFTDYRGLDVAGISDLRRKLSENDAEMKIAKKTLISLAAKENKIEIDPSSMEGPVAATFSYKDPFSGIQALFKFSKENDKLKLLGGVINGEAVGPEVIEKYAKLPSHEELLAKFIGSINAPVSGFVGTLGNVLGGFVRAISAYKDTLPQEAPKAEVKEEPKEAVSNQQSADQPAEEVSTEEKKEEAPVEEEKKEDIPTEESAPAEEQVEEKTEEAPAESNEVEGEAQAEPAETPEEKPVEEEKPEESGEGSSATADKSESGVAEDKPEEEEGSKKEAPAEEEKTD